MKDLAIKDFLISPPGCKKCAGIKRRIESTKRHYTRALKSVHACYFKKKKIQGREGAPRNDQLGKDPQNDQLGKDTPFRLG